ncbi:MAG: aldehyde dehydrogenase family protein [Euryarchaeota archaeon]|nr:aldehyde dehydrogenase family protein [Euryarchaeota archaeon]
MSIQAILTREKRKILVAVNPATMEKLGEVPLLSRPEIEAMVAEADRAFPGWAALPVSRRVERLRRAQDYIVDHLDEIAETISKDMGKPRFEAIVHDILTVANLIDYYSKKGPRILADEKIRMSMLFRPFKESTIVRQPYGVVVVISPWNYPFAIPVSGIVFALLAGNTVVFKPASEVAHVGMKIRDIFEKGAGLPPGVFHLVLASGSDIGDSLFKPPVRKVIFTGSTEVGKEIIKKCSEHIIPTVQELGGKDPMVVLPDADLELASNGAVWGAFTNCGQVCASIERCYVHESIYDEFVKRVAEKTKALTLGRWDDPATQVGPMVSPGQLQIVESQVKDAVKSGARVLAGGRNREDMGGYFYEPTVLVDVTHQMKVMNDETFGPVLPIMKFRTDEEAVQLANYGIYGLTASVWGKDRGRAWDMARQIEAGTVCVNDHAYTYGAVETPWQGFKQSGLGVSHSKWGLLEFVQPKHINRSGGLLGGRADREVTRPWFYPYDAQKLSIFRDLSRQFFDRRKSRISKIGLLPKALKLFRAPR